MQDILIRNGLLIDPASGSEEAADLLIADGRIKAIEAAGSIEAAGARQIDASGLCVAPGLVDLCARLREPGQEHKATIESESLAACRAGITTLCCPPDTDPVIDEPAVVELIHQKAAAAGHSRILTLGALTTGLDGCQLSEMAALQEAGCVGLSNCRRPVDNTLVLKRAFAYAATFGLRVFIEPDDPALSADGCAHEGRIATRLGLKGIPVSAETSAIARALELVLETGVSAHFGRLSSARAVTMIERAKQEQLPVTADVSAHQLFLNETDISSFNSASHVIPPLRSQRDQEALQHGVAAGIIDAICSDHQPHNHDAKEAPFAATEAGISALETFLPLSLRLQQQGMSLAQILQRISLTPARILGMEHKGLTIGAQADLCIFDADEDWQLSEENMSSHGHNSPFIGWNFQGRAVYTLLDGKVIYSA